MGDEWRLLRREGREEEGRRRGRKEKGITFGDSE